MENVRSKYQWPASAIGVREMEILYNWKKRTGTPINELLRQAINVCDKLVEKEVGDDTTDY